MYQGRTYQISKLPELDYAINVTVFGDILELDEDEEYFSRSLVCDYFTLAQRTFAEMDACLSVHDRTLTLPDKTDIKQRNPRYRTTMEQSPVSQRPQCDIRHLQGRIHLRSDRAIDGSRQHVPS